MAAPATVDLFDPIGVPAYAHDTRPVRMEGLAGKKVGFLANHLDCSVQIFREVGARMVKTYHLGAVVHQDKHICSAPARPEVIRRLVEECDAVVTGVGL